MDQENKLTEEKYWSENYRGNFRRPIVIDYKKNLALAEIHSFLKSILPINKQFKFLEVGCAPGSWMYYFNENFGYQVEGIEYTENGVDLTKKNLEKLNVSTKVYHQDFLNNTLPLSSYDVVFSGGFIEHFDNPEIVVRKHIELLKPGGILILEIPNLRGVNYFFQNIIDGGIVKIHNTKIMNLDYFYHLGDSCGLNKIALRYIGKINFGLFAGSGIFLKIGYVIQTLLNYIYFTWTKNIFCDSKWVSPYIVAIYQKK